MNSTAIWYATRATGLMALVLLTGTMVLGITTTTRRGPGTGQGLPSRRSIAASP